MGFSLPERLREVAEEDLELDHGEDAEYEYSCEDIDDEECDVDDDDHHHEVLEDEHDDRAGALLCFLMELQATAIDSFVNNVPAGKKNMNGGGAEFDPKTYVDLPLKGALDVTVAAFRALPRAPVTGSVSPGWYSTIDHSKFLRRAI